MTDNTTNDTTNTAAKCGFLDEIKDGLLALEQFGEDTLAKIEAFFGLKKDQIALQDQGQPAPTSDEVVAAAKIQVANPPAVEPATSQAPDPTPGVTPPADDAPLPQTTSLN